MFPNSWPFKWHEKVLRLRKCLRARISSVQLLSHVRLFMIPCARLPCPSPTPRAYSNSSPLSQWCHPTILSSVIPFSSHLQSFPASGSFPMSQFFESGGQSIGASASASVLPMNLQDWFPLRWTAVQGTLKSLLQHHSSKASKGHISNLPKTARIEKGACRSAPVAKWLGFWAFTSVARGQSLVPGCGTEIPQVVQCGQKKRKKKRKRSLDLVIPHSPLTDFYRGWDGHDWIGYRAAVLFFYFCSEWVSLRKQRGQVSALSSPSPHLAES